MTNDPSSQEPTVQQLFDLTGQTALVTGATGHLGKSLATALAEAGSRVVVTSRDANRAEQTARQLPTPAGTPHLGVALNQLQSEQNLSASFQQILRDAGSIDILVNNAHEPSGDDWAHVSGADFTRQLANATGYFLLARMTRDHAVERGAPASIILLGSMYGQVGSYPDAYEGVSPASPASYHALKGSIIQLTRHLAVYWARDRVRVNCLSPGPFPGPRAPRDLIPRLEPHVPLGRIGQPFELKGAIVFLASAASSYMTGQNLTIDGGWTAW